MDTAKNTMNAMPFAVASQCIHINFAIFYGTLYIFFMYFL